MSETLPIWRQALNDSSHPLHSAAWTIFSPEMKVASADKRLADSKEQVIPFLIEILDTPDLYLDTALGSGEAPINAVELLGHWKVLESAPCLLKIMEEQDWETIIHDRALVALENMGPGVVDVLLPVAQQTTDEDQRRTFASIFSHAGKGDPRAYEYVRTVFDQQTEEHDIEYMAENLLACDYQAASSLLEEQIRQRKYNKRLRQRMEYLIREAKKDHMESDRGSVS